jgi:GntR family transcriptional regulator, transcriptional repressor for pyruvate dehydrogenase complex
MGSGRDLDHKDNFGINPVKPPAAYELVVDQIRRALALGRFNPGDMLPSERGLAQQLGVSRTVVREAIRVLEGEGLLEVTRGASGGSRVLPAARDQRLSAAELRDQADEIQQVTDFRLATECAAARGAALHRSEAESARLQELVELQEELLEAAAQTDDESERTRLTSRFIEVDNRFHLSVAAASHNHYLQQAVETGRINMRRPVGTIFATTTDDVNFQHREIADAIEAADPEAAEAAMANHIRATHSTTMKHLKDPTAVV